MKFGSVVASMGGKDAIKYAVLSERLGFDSLWVTDHLIDTGGIKVEPWTTIGAIASQTSRILLCSAVTDAVRMHPARTAHTLVTLDEISDGRVCLGIGAGEAMNLVPFGLPFEKPAIRAEKLGEAIQVVRLLWNSSRQRPVSFEGRHFRLDNAWLDIELKTGRRPPIYVGALGGQKALEVAGKYGDGWLPWLNTPETYRKRLDVVRSAARTSGRDPDSLDAVVYMYTCITEDGEVLRRAINHTKRALLGEMHTLKLLGFELPRSIDRSYQNMLVDDRIDQLLLDSQDAVPDEIALRCLAGGSANDVMHSIEKFRDAGASHVIAQLLFPSEERLRFYAREVMPHFQSERA